MKPSTQSSNLHAQISTSDQHIDLMSSSPGTGPFRKSKADRKRTLVAISCGLAVALGAIVIVIGSSSAEAATNLPTFTVANALAAKQDAGVAGVATASLAFIAVGALAFFSRKRK